MPLWLEDPVSPWHWDTGVTKHGLWNQMTGFKTWHYGQVTFPCLGLPICQVGVIMHSLPFCEQTQ